MINGINVFIVGGFIRDLLLDREPNDVDVLVGDKGKERKLATLTSRELGVKPIHFSPHDTSRIHHDGIQVDFSAPHSFDDAGDRKPS
jgi:tRNA nucleotidyltransferase/poly(A) polymerase